MKTTSAIRELWRRRAKRELLAFTKWTFPAYQIHWHHQLLAAKLDAWREGRIRQLLISMPPRHGKTELVCRRLPALILGANPNARIIMATHTAALAEANSRDVQRVIASAAYQELFPQVRLPKPGLRQQGRYKRTDEHWEIDREVLLDAIFYGRYAVVNTVRWRFYRGKPVLCVVRWRPLHGDKLVWRWDDGSGDYDPDCVGIRISQHGQADYVSQWKQYALANGGQILPTAQGMAYFPPPHLRELIVIHRHMIEDGDFHSPENAARIFGVGIRSRIYWTWYQKQEALAWLMEYLERSAFGLELWYYPAGSEQGKQATIEAATERIGNARNILVIPRPVGPEGQMFGVEVIERNMAGATALKEIITDYFGHQIKRYILGQTLTTEAHATGLGSNLASIHLDTFLQIVKADAQNLAETLTADLVARLVRWNWPSWQDNPLRLVIETEKPDAEERLRGIRMAYEMGLKIRARDVRELLGLAEPQPDEEVLTNREENGMGNPRDILGFTLPQPPTD